MPSMKSIQHWLMALCALTFLAGLCFVAQANAAPVCYPPQAANAKASTTPDGFVVTWYCATGGAWTPVAFYGHWSELATDWQAQLVLLLSGSKASRDAAWTAGVTGPVDATLKAATDAQLAATLPTPPIPATQTAYYIVQQKKKLVLLAVGKVPSTTPVDTTQTVMFGAQMYCVVPIEALVPFGPGKWTLIYAPCLG